MWIPHASSARAQSRCFMRCFILIDVIDVIDVVIVVIVVINVIVMVLTVVLVVGTYV